MDKNSFSCLYSASRKDLYKYCRTLCGNDADAQDLMQQTYLKALENLEKLYDENFPAWLRSVARNIFLDNLRKSKHESVEEYPEIPDNSRNPEFIAEKRDICRILLKSLKDCLSPVQKMTVILYYYDEKSVSEIARIMHCSVGTVESRLYYARKKLREELKKFGNIFTCLSLGFAVIKHKLKNIQIPVNARITVSAVLTTASMALISVSYSPPENKLPDTVIKINETNTSESQTTAEKILKSSETAFITPISHATTNSIYTIPTSESHTTAFKSEYEEIIETETEEPTMKGSDNLQENTSEEETINEYEEVTTMKKEIISAVTAITTAFSGMTMTTISVDNTMPIMTTNAYDAKNKLPWYYNTDTGELSNFSEVIYNHHLDWIKAYDNYYDAEFDVYCERVDYLAEEINSYLPSVSLGAEKVWKISFPTGATNIYTLERVPDCLRLRLNAHYLTDERKEDGVTIPQEVYDSLFYEFKDYILSEFGDRFAVEYDGYQGYGSPRFDYIYGVGEQSWISLTFDSSDKAENYETACEITQKLVDKYGSKAFSSDLWLDCHGVGRYSFSDNEFESNGFSAIDPQQLKGYYCATAEFTKIDVTRGFAYFDVTGLADELDLQPITENAISPENIQIAENSPAEVSLLGDANCDGNVTISDAIAVLQYNANSVKYPLSEQGKLNADIYNTGDGITGLDASYIQQLEATKS